MEKEALRLQCMWCSLKAPKHPQRYLGTKSLSTVTGRLLCYRFLFTYFIPKHNTQSTNFPYKMFSDENNTSHDYCSKSLQLLPLSPL